jgi:hypothetical protein
LLAHVLLDLKTNSSDPKKPKTLSWPEIIKLYQEGELKEWSSLAVERHKTIDTPEELWK